MILSDVNGIIVELCMLEELTAIFEEGFGATLPTCFVINCNCRMQVMKPVVMKIAHIFSKYFPDVLPAPESKSLAINFLPSKNNSLKIY